MDGIETAIRNALAKGDAGDPKFREKVYLSALQALERSLRANPAPDEAATARRRQMLRDRIRHVETEFQPAAEPAGEHPIDVTRTAPAVASVDAPSLSQEPAPPVVSTEPPQQGQGDFVSQLRVTRKQEQDDDGLQIAPDQPVISPPRRRPFSWLLSSAVVIAFVVIGLWWLYSSGALVPLSERDGAVPNPPQQLKEDEFKPAQVGTTTTNEPSDAQNGTWLTIFDPSDPTTVTAPSGTTVDVVGEGKNKAIRITPEAIDSAALFDVGQGVLDQIAGRKVTFEISALTPEGKDTQMSIQCNLAELGDCGRKRYDVEAARNNFLFELETPERSAGSFGSISITPDIAQGKVPVDVFMIRVFVPDTQ